MLDDLYAQIPLTSDSKKIEAIRSELENLAGKYQTLYRGGTINYNSPVTRFAYMYCYVAPHADVMYQIIKDNQSVTKILSNREINIACLGGGPGSDLLGMLKFMRLENVSTKLTCNIYDREGSWEMCIASITNQIRNFTDTMKITPTISGNVFFRELDIVKDFNKVAQDDFTGVNLLTISFLVSEIKQAEAKTLFLEIFEKVSSGCLLILMDNSSGDAHTRFDTFVNEYNYCSFYDSIQTIKSEHKRFNIDVREDKEYLEPYFSKLYPRYPRLKLPVHYRIYRKE